MQVTSLWKAYEDRINRVIAYIQTHLDEELDMEKLAEVACLSPYHWHRIYRGIMGETAIVTVRRLRLQRAARGLVESARPIAAIAAECGFANVPSFIRSFKAAYGLPPSDFRRSGNHAALKTAIRNGDFRMYDVDFKMLQTVEAFGLDHKGAYTTIGIAFEKLAGLMATRNLFDHGARVYGVYYDDPESVPEAELRSTACIELNDPARVIEPPLRRLTIEGGRYAVLTHKGPYSDLHVAYEWLYRHWLPKANVTVRNVPPLEVYLNSPRDVGPQDLITEICIPVE